MKPIARLTTAIMALIAALHLVRLVLGTDANVAGWQVPLWMSGVACVFFGTVAVLLYREQRSG